MYIKKRWAVLSVVLFIAVAAVIGGFALTFYSEKQAAEMKLGYMQRENIASLSESLEEIEYSLQKGKYAASPYQAVVLASSVLLEAGGAKENLQHLPITDVKLSDVAKYLSQTGEYVFLLAEKTVRGEEITAEDYKTLSEMSEKASALATEMRNFNGEITEENCDYTALSLFYKATEALPAASGAAAEKSVFEKIESLFKNVSPLYYDGKFSDKQKAEPDGFWTGKPEISKDAAREKAAYVFDIKTESVSGGETVERDGFSCYEFGAYNGDRQAVIIKNGGYLYSYINNISSGDAVLSEDEAIAKAENFLKRAGFENMTVTEKDYTGNTLAVTFVSEKDGVIVYPEKVVVGVSLDNGEIISFTSSDFWQNLKKDRTFSFNISEDAAAKKVSERLEIRSVNKAFCLSDGGREYPCYEFICRGEENGEIRVYINSKTGVEEKITLVSETDTGVFFE